MATKALCTIDGCDKPVFARHLCQPHYESADFRPDCSVPGCDRKASRRGLCRMHAKREERHGSPNKVLRAGNRSKQRWIEAHVSYDGDDCIAWPYSTGNYGYGDIRTMCRLAHGEPPTPHHQAAHSCGNGHLGCMNPKHLRWATRKENQADMVAHGRSQRGSVNYHAKLTEQDVREIRRLLSSMTQAAIAKKYGIDPSTVSDIHRGKHWGWV